MNKKYPLVAIIIVNWNGKLYLEKCLHSLSRIYYPKDKTKIILVDNGSKDGSVSWARREHPKIRIIESTVNVGFAKANNIAINTAFIDNDVKYIATLNNDTEVDRNWLFKLVEFMERNKKVGMAVGKILQFYNRRKIDSCGDCISKDGYRIINRGYGEEDYGQYDIPMEVFSASAAASIYRRKTLEDIKICSEFFDEDFLSYFEDVDLNMRARLRGWLCFYVPGATVYHIGSATSSKMGKEYKEYLSRRNRILSIIKNIPFRYMVFLLLRYLVPSRSGITLYSKGKIEFYSKQDNRYHVLRKNNLTPYEASIIYLKATFGVLTLFPKMMKKRNIILKKKSIPNEEVEGWFKRLICQ